MQEYFIEGEELESLIVLFSSKLGLPADALREKLSGMMQDGKLKVNEQIFALLSDRKKLETLLNSGIVNRIVKDFMGRANG